jgi:hypothetical protein
MDQFIQGFSGMKGERDLFQDDLRIAKDGLLSTINYLSNVVEITGQSYADLDLQGLVKAEIHPARKAWYETSQRPGNLPGMESDRSSMMLTSRERGLSLSALESRILHLSIDAHF